LGRRRLKRFEEASSWGATMVRVIVEAPVRPSEDPAKVEAAVRRLFPDAEVVSHQDGMLLATSSSLAEMEALLHKQRILDAARGVFLHAVAADGSSATFRVGKQAAFVGHVSFSVGESALGDITVTVEDENVEQVLRAVAPKTKKGFPVSEEQAARIEAREQAERDARKALAMEGKGGEE
jgi:predicted RNA binding protein with dsRBD fold (UPF0201 family)